jgi:hypothetical protein
VDWRGKGNGAIRESIIFRSRRVFEAALLAPIAMPAISDPLDFSENPPPSFQAPVAIYDRIIAFKGANANLHYVRVPMAGDINQDGVVNILDFAAAAICFGVILKSESCQ